MTHILDNQEVIEALQSDAIQIHKQHVFAMNNAPTPITREYLSDLSQYDSLLGSIEQQLNNLFI